MRDEQLIDVQNIKPVADMDFTNGFSFGPATRTSAYVFAIFGIFALFVGGAGFFFGTLLVLAAAYALSARFGTQISSSSQMIREYDNVFGFKLGKWKSMAALPDICILKLGKTQKLGGFRTGSVNIELDVSKNEVYLMTPNHRARILVRVCNSKKEAFDFARDLSGKLGKRIAEFNPVVSEQTRSRR